LGIDPCQVRAFVQIAIDSSKRKVVEVIGSAVNSWNDVFDGWYRTPSGSEGIPAFKLSL